MMFVVKKIYIYIPTYIRSIYNNLKYMRDLRKNLNFYLQSIYIGRYKNSIVDAYRYTKIIL